MIANISPAASSFGETLSTLRFAQRAKMIKNRASINQESMGTTENLRKEIYKLREELAGANNLISTFENGERLRITIPSDGKMITEKEITENKEDLHTYTNALLSGNKAQLELEVLLRESMSVLYESEKHLQDEIERKDEFLGMFENLCDLHKENDTKIKSLLTLYEKKINEQGMDEEDNGMDKYK